MLGEGFEEVYHLKGGILKYLEEVPEAQSRWKGDASCSTTGSPFATTSVPVSSTWPCRRARCP